MSSLRLNTGPARSTATIARPTEVERDVLNDDEFRRMLALERKRSERTKAPFMLMLADCPELQEQSVDEATLGKIASVLHIDSRETDVIGWYKDRSTLGVLFTGLTAIDRGALFETISGRVRSSLERNLALDEYRQVRLTFHFFPDDWNLTDCDSPGDSALYIDVKLAAKQKRVLFAVKRLIDIVFGALLLIALSPVFLCIALAIRATSRGPVFFKQKRIGQYGNTFVFLKFRSMYENSEVLIHKNFVTELIGNSTSEPVRDERGNFYKIQDDYRVTPVGRFIRRTSLDELPQLLNVLKGEMSLVGPRPAIPYEVEAYQTWHRRRVLVAKPGMTGIWQVAGRSRVKFDEMVRMDLRYAMAWTPWLDLKILLLTPFAVIRGSGAY